MVHDPLISSLLAGGEPTTTDVNTAILWKNRAAAIKQLIVSWENAYDRNLSGDMLIMDSYFIDSQTDRVNRVMMTSYSSKMTDDVHQLVVWPSSIPSSLPILWWWLISWTVIEVSFWGRYDANFDSHAIQARGNSDWHYSIYLVNEISWHKHLNQVASNTNSPAGWLVNVAWPSNSPPLVNWALIGLSKRENGQVGIKVNTLMSYIVDIIKSFSAELVCNFVEDYIGND